VATVTPDLSADTADLDKGQHRRDKRFEGRFVAAQEVENKRQLEALRNQLLAGVADFGLSVSPDKIDTLMAYVALLDRWNQAYNLTAIRERERMISHHLLDSLAIANDVQGPRVLDVGTGPGLPGIPLAIWLPAIEFVLLDSNGKKTRFLVQAKSELGLNNVEVVQARVQDYRPQAPFDSVMARAFAALADILEWSRHLCRPGGRYLLLKGRLDPAEIETLPGGFTLLETRRLAVPGVEGERHLLIVAPVSTAGARTGANLRYD
jgi:16S rRNA (guanine527-N7)-methyltransferase